MRSRAFIHSARWRKDSLSTWTLKWGLTSGLPPNQAWAATLAAIRLIPSKDFGKDGLVQRVGTLSNTLEANKLREHIENSGGDERLSQNRYGGPRMAKPREDLFGVYMRSGAGSNRRFDETEYIKPEPKTRRRRADFEGQVIDIDLDIAVEKLGLDKSVAELFSSPSDGRVKKFTTLRAVNDLFAGDAETAARYIPKEAGLPAPVMLKDLVDSEIHIGVVNGLASPKIADAKPVTDLGEAFELVTKRPQDMTNYMFISGPKLSRIAVDDITAAYEKRVVATTPEARLAEAKSSVRTAWRGLMDGYTNFMTSRTVPEALRDKDGQPVWKFVPKAP